MNLFRVVLFAASVFVGPSLFAVTTIYPVEAIEDLWSLPAEDFRKKYAGINVTGLGPSDEGWYVRYRHENLTCLFGPLVDREEARKRKWEMETVRDAAIRNRPSLNTSQVDFVRFTFSAVYGKAGDGSGTGGLGEMGRMSGDGKSGPDGDLDGDGIPNAQDDDMDGDGTPNTQDDDMDGDGVSNATDDYGFGTMDAQLRGSSGLGGNGRDGPDGDMDGDGTANAADGDMDGDGIPNDQDPDSDGDGVPNAQDKYPHGKDDGPDGNSGSGRPAGTGNQSGAIADRNSGASGDQAGREGGQQGQSGQSGQSGSQQQMGSQAGQRQVASNQRGSQMGQQGSQQGQQGQPGQPGSQSQSGQQSSSSSSSSSQSSQSGGPPGPPSSGGSGSPMNIITALMKMILGI